MMTIVATFARKRSISLWSAFIILRYAQALISAKYVLKKEKIKM